MRSRRKKYEIIVFTLLFMDIFLISLFLVSSKGVNFENSDIFYMTNTPKDKVSILEVKFNKSDKIYQPNEDIKLTFTIASSSVLTPVEIRINDNYYEVIKDTKEYYAIIPGFTEVGNQKIIIEQIRFNSGYILNVKNNDINNQNKIIIKDESTEIVYEPVITPQEPIEENNEQKLEEKFLLSQPKINCPILIQYENEDIKNETDYKLFYEAIKLENFISNHSEMFYFNK